MPTDRPTRPDTAAIRVSNYTAVQIPEGFDSVRVLEALLKKGKHINELCDYIDSIPDETVTVEQVREFIEELLKTGYSSMKSGPGELNKVLEFIDNGPKKRNAVETVYDNADGGITISQSRTIVQALRDAGYLKDEA